MTSFGWKRKAVASVIRAAATSFEDDVKDEDDNEVTRGEVDWLTLAPKRSRTQLEDARAKGQRLRAEGATLAEAERYWEAISRWDEGLLITPLDSKMLEMKAQALMALGEPFAAVQAAEQAVRAEPTWWVARQTLGRAQLNLGEVKLAVNSFCKALLINPTEQELWEKDLPWARSVKDRMQYTAATQSPTAAPKITPVPEGSVSGTMKGEAGTATVGGSHRTPRSREAERRLLKLPKTHIHLRG